jgi:hypothetical protein
VTDLCNESYKSLKKETNEDIRKWKHIPCLHTGRIKNVKMSILAIKIYMFNAIPIKIQIIISLEVHMEAQKTSKSQNNPEPKSNAGSITIPDFKVYYRAIVIKRA